VARTRPTGDTGQRGEAAAAAFLQDLGFRIVAQNLRTRAGEVDLLVRRRRLYVAVEVKTRRSDPAPEQAVSSSQLARLEQALVRLAPHLRPAPRQLRVDVVAVRWTAGTPPEVRHFPGQEWPPMP
jgi:putative endonuclease